MAAHPAPEPTSPAAELWRRRGRLLLLGGVLASLGAGAAVTAAATPRFSVGMLGAVLVTGGAVESAHAFRFWRSRWASFVPALLVGVLYLVCGLLLVAGPRPPAAGVTLLLTVVLIAGGTLRLLWSLAASAPGRGASIAHGSVTLLLGALLWALWPATSLWAVGVFVGADLLASGAVLLFLAMEARGLAPHGA
ncbi:MAG TPA: DUF308 domain-containing protein [Longimicrobium sp.]|nr:DUF308 domain-containing protein [Longimicrobium sp.]